MKVLLSFWPLCNIFLRSFPALHSMFSTFLEGKNWAEWWARALWFLFIWDPQFLAALVWYRIPIFVFPAPWDWHKLRDAAFCLACIPCSGNRQIPHGGSGDLLCVSLLKAPGVLALSVVLSVPLDSSVCFVFYVTFIVVFSGKFGLVLLFPHSLT